MSKGKMPAVKEKAQISHLQNHPDKRLLVRCKIFPYLQLQVKPCGFPTQSEPLESRGTMRPPPCHADKMFCNQIFLKRAGVPQAAYLF